MEALPGFEEAEPRPALRDHVSGGQLLQPDGAHFLVGRSEICTSLDRWNWGLQNGGVGGKRGM